MTAAAVQWQLWDAVRRADGDALDTALAAGADPHRGQGGWTPLGKALRSRWVEGAVRLLQAGVDPTVRDGDQRRPMTQALLGNLPSVVSDLLRRGIIPCWSDVMTVCQAGDHTLFGLLWPHYAGPVWQDKDKLSERFKSLAAMWPAKAWPAPEALMRATENLGPTHRVWRSVLDAMVSERRCELGVWIWADRERQQHWSALAMALAVRSGWKEGGASVLGACPEAAQDERQEAQFHVMTEAMSAFARHSRPAEGWRQLHALMEAGFRVDFPVVRRTYPGEIHIPLLLAVALQMPKLLKHRRLVIEALLARGQDLVAALPALRPDGRLQANTLMHLLLRSGDSILPRWLIREHPGALWEHADASLLAAAVAGGPHDCIDGMNDLLILARQAGAQPSTGLAGQATALHELMAELDYRGRLPNSPGHPWLPQVFLHTLDRLFALGCQTHWITDAHQRLEGWPEAQRQWEAQQLREAVGTGMGVMVARPVMRRI